jgi:hypothetical protein
MYVLPRAFDSEHLNTTPESAASSDYTQIEPQDIRALPAPAGDALLWSGRTLHFGGRGKGQLYSWDGILTACQLLIVHLNHASVSPSRSAQPNSSQRVYA